MFLFPLNSGLKLWKEDGESLSGFLPVELEVQLDPVVS
jgi:hypothetical protein